MGYIIITVNTRLCSIQESLESRQGGSQVALAAMEDNNLTFRPSGAAGSVGVGHQREQTRLMLFFTQDEMTLLAFISEEGGSLSANLMWKI